MLPGSMSKSLRATVASIALYAALICGLKYLTLSETGSPACGQRQGRLGTRGTSHPTVTCSEAFMLIQAFDRPYKREIGRASCRERGYIAVRVGAYEKKVKRKLSNTVHTQSM